MASVPIFLPHSKFITSVVGNNNLRNNGRKELSNVIQFQQRASSYCLVNQSRENMTLTHNHVKNYKACGIFSNGSLSPVVLNQTWYIHSSTHLLIAAESQPKFVDFNK
ncbi:unnamed protein product [Candida parapsilosis]